jgi:NAD(P)-dependent dehydrogenase (short-subunit alcohol dehydrogenase family)
VLLGKTKTAIVTGAMSPLGKEVVKKLSENFNVLMTGTTPIENQNYFKADLTKPAEVEALTQWALEKGKTIDCLVCCAGGNMHRGEKIKSDDAISLDMQDLLTQFNRNVVTATNCVHYIVPHMLRQKYGRICFVGSHVVGTPRPNGFLTSYGVAKAALHEFTAHLAHQLAGSGVYVNCVAPGGISGRDTDVTQAEVVHWIDAFCSPLSKTNGQVLRLIKCPGPPKH